MIETDPAGFSPPSPDQLKAHLRRHPATGPSRLFAWLPILALAAAVVSMMWVESSWLQSLPWMILVAFLGFMVYRVHWARQLEAQVTSVQELTMLRRYPVAMRLAWRTLPKVTVAPILHGRIVAFMAHVLDHLRAYDAAIVAYDHLIDHLPLKHPGSVQLRIHRAMAQLNNGQLSDADDGLRALRGAETPMRNPTTGATFRLAKLTQQVCTNHYAEAVNSAGKLVDDLRPLGVDAGYGHALMAFCFHMLSSADDRLHETAAPWWARATLLLPPAALVERFPELTALADRYSSSSSDADLLELVSPASGIEDDVDQRQVLRGSLPEGPPDQSPYSP